MNYSRRVAGCLRAGRHRRQHRAARDAALGSLAFPEVAFRQGQRDLAEAVYRTAVNRRCLLAQAPTGIGKTVGTLFPLLRAMPDHGIDKIAHLACKETARLTALGALQGLRDGTAGQDLREPTLVAKEPACKHPDKACHPDACPLASGFYNRLPAARQQAVSEGWLDAATQRRVALRHRICVYYLGQELVRWADVLVGDVHHLFDSKGQLWGLMQALDWPSKRATRATDSCTARRWPRSASRRVIKRGGPTSNRRPWPRSKRAPRAGIRYGLRVRFHGLRPLGGDHPLHLASSSL